MRPVVLRDEEPPDDSTIVVRGGLLLPDSVRRAAAKGREEYGFFGVSVYCAIGMTVAELVANVAPIGPDIDPKPGLDVESAGLELGIDL